MLTNKMRKHLESNWQGVSTDTKEKQLKRIRGYIVQALDDLVLTVNTLPAEEQNEIFLEDRIRPLVSALLTASSKKRVGAKNDESRAIMVDREFQIAAMFMQKGISKCLNRVRKPFGDRTLNDAIDLMQILHYEATNGKSGGASLNITEKKTGEWREKVHPLLPI